MFYNTGIGTYIWIVTNRKEKRRKGKIQLVDARDVWTAGRQRGQQAQPRRQAPAHRPRPARSPRSCSSTAAAGDGETSKIFDNADFGYTRVTVERPLRLRYQMTIEDKARFLEACPHLLDDVQAIDKALGREPHRDWNEVWAASRTCCKKRESRWKATEQKLFRSVFTQKDPRPSRCQGRTRRRLSSRTPTCAISRTCRSRKTSTPTSSARCVPHVPDAWMDRSKDKVGYEINFNRHFYKYTPPRGLAEIDADLKGAEDEILRLLREVTE